jgi:hypothetical protein
MFDKLLIIWDRIFDIDNWCKQEDRAFYKLFVVFVFLTTWILVGTYLYDPDMLLIFFWPLNL